jgi:hypothetical protein
MAAGEHEGQSGDRALHVTRDAHSRAGEPVVRVTPKPDTTPGEPEPRPRYAFADASRSVAADSSIVIAV